MLKQDNDFASANNAHTASNTHVTMVTTLSLSSGPRCNHLIPVEIAEQVCTMIEKGRRFAAYILIPLFPEGRYKNLEYLR